MFLKISHNFVDFLGDGGEWQWVDNEKIFEVKNIVFCSLINSKKMKHLSH